MLGRVVAFVMVAFVISGCVTERDGTDFAALAQKVGPPKSRPSAHRGLPGKGLWGLGRCGVGRETRWRANERVEDGNLCVCRPLGWRPQAVLVNGVISG